MSRILIIDDEVSVCESLRFALQKKYDIRTATSPENLDKILEGERVDVILLDLRIGKYNGIDVLKSIRMIDPTISVIMMTAFGDDQTAIESIRLGAYKYLLKPVAIEEMIIYIEQALEYQRLSEEINFLSKELHLKEKSYDMIGNSQPMRKVFDLINKLKDVDTSVMLLGESGTGKELVARAIHYSGKRSAGRFVVVNCAAIPEGLLEEEFFGHRKGSFTGAVDNKVGKLASANHGTLFLDEIGDLPLSMQGKLLRALQDKEFVPIGSNVPQKTDIRVIAATNRNLTDMIKKGTFREDLYYRLRVMDITLPPLRERKNDIPALCDSFVNMYNLEQKKNVKCISTAAQRLLMKYDYPGNVRQLGNIIEHAMILTTGDIIDVQMLPEELQESERSTMQFRNELPEFLENKTLKEIEKIAIEAALKRANGKKSAAAEMLGISERGLWYKIKEYQI